MHNLYNKIFENRKVLITGHTGFCKPMDILRDNYELNKMWSSGTAPWKVW